MNRPASHNVKVAGTLAWEFWTHGWRGFLLAQVVVLLVQGFVFALMSVEGRLPGHSSQEGAWFYFYLYWPTVIWLGSAVLWASGNPKLRYTLPAPSFLLVAAPMACAMATMFVQCSIAAMTVGALFGGGRPIWGPALLAAALIGWCQVVLWSTTNSNSLALRFLVCLASLMAFVRWGPPHGQTMAAFLQSLSGWHVFAFGVAMLACVGLGTVGFARLRHGSIVDVQPLADRLNKRFRFLNRARAKPFSSLPAAQFWLEWMERGYVLPLGATLLGFVVLAVAVYERVRAAPTAPGDLAAAATVFTFAPLLTIGFFWGSRSRNFEYRAFAGSRPLSDGQMAVAILKSATVALILSAVIWAAFMALIVLLARARLGAPSPFAAVRQTEVLAFLAGATIDALAAWSVVGFCTSLALAGKKAIGIAFGLAVAAYLVTALVMCWNSKRAIEVYLIACLILLLLGSAATFAASWRRRLIAWRTLAWSALIVAAAIAAIATLGGFEVRVNNWETQLVIVASCGFLPLPLAAAPLAIYVNRHR